MWHAAATWHDTSRSAQHQTWHESFIWDMVTGHIHVWHDSSIWDLTHTYMTWVIHMRHDELCLAGFNAKLMWHDSSIWNLTHTCMTWVIHMRHDESRSAELNAKLATGRICLWLDSLIWDLTHTHMTWVVHMRHDEPRPAELNAKTTTGCTRDTPYDIFLHAYVIRIILYFYTPRFMCYTLQSKRRLDAYACDMTHPYETHPYENNGIHTWHDFVWDMMSHVPQGVTRNYCEMTHLYETWRIHIWH